MKIYFAGLEILDDFFKKEKIELKERNQLYSYFFLKNKPNYIKELKDDSKQK
jgi:hypothetical protein